MLLNAFTVPLTSDTPPSLMVSVFAGSSADAIVVEPVVLEVSAVQLQVLATWLYMDDAGVE
jgi:hypothetical protein